MHIRAFWPELVGFATSLFGRFRFVRLLLPGVLPAAARQGPAGAAPAAGAGHGRQRVWGLGRQKVWGLAIIAHCICTGVLCGGFARKSMVLVYPVVYLIIP